MVNALRRFRKYYSLNSRHHGVTMQEIRRANQCRRFALFLHLIYLRNPTLQLRQTIVTCILFFRNVFGNRVAVNPVFLPRRRILADYSDTQLYHIRITRRVHIPRLITALEIPNEIKCPNGTKCNGEEAFLMFLYWLSMPRLLAHAQYFYGREYSQISRIVREVARFLIVRWHHVVDDNLDYFAQRFPLYCAAITAKFVQLNGLMDPKVEPFLLHPFYFPFSFALPFHPHTSSVCAHCSFYRWHPAAAQSQPT